jgi:hypothetical protein
MGLSFTTAAGPRQLTHSRVRVPRDSWPHYTFSDWRLPQSGRPGPRIYIPQEQVSPVIPQALGSDFVASYDSQGYGGGTRTGLYTGLLELLKVTLRLTVGQSVCLSWCRAPFWDHDQVLVPVWQLLTCQYGAPSLTRGRVCRLSEAQSAVISQLSVCAVYLHFTRY